MSKDTMDRTRYEEGGQTQMLNWPISVPLGESMQRYKSYLNCEMFEDKNGKVWYD
jgi:hypothetical protein